MKTLFENTQKKARYNATDTSTSYLPAVKMMTLACILQDVVRHVNVIVTQLEAKKRKTF